MKRYDLCVSGAGAGSLVLDRVLEQGVDCLLAEGYHLAGTCLIFGCIPTKILTTLAKAAGWVTDRQIDASDAGAPT